MPNESGNNPESHDGPAWLEVFGRVTGKRMVPRPQDTPPYRLFQTQQRQGRLRVDKKVLIILFLSVRHSPSLRQPLRSIYSSFQKFCTRNGLDRRVTQNGRTGFQLLIPVGRASSPSIKCDRQSRVLRGTSPPNPLPFRDYF